MKKSKAVPLRSTRCYDAMLKAYNDGMAEFEFEDEWHLTDDIFTEFSWDLKHGRITVAGLVTAA